MKALKRYKYHLIAAAALMALLFMGAKTKMSQVTKSADELPQVGSTYQMNQALELFPEDKGVLAMVATGNLDMRDFIFTVVQRSLPESQQGRAFEIAHAVISESNHVQMDPLFLLAVISTESQFNIQAYGSHGEIGLMQLLPATAKWLAPHAGLPKDFDLQQPAINIRLGATYLASLRHSFKSNSKRYVSAYNMGSRNVRRLLASNTEPEIYSSRVLNNYAQLYNTLEMIGSTLNTRGLASTK